MRIGLKVLADSAKCSKYREQIEIEEIASVKSCLDGYVGCISDKTLTGIHHAFRYLRNACVDCSKNQNLIISINALAPSALLLSNLLDPSLLVKSEDLLTKTKMTCLQFLGNFVVNNENARESVWNAGFPNLFFKAMSNLDGKGKDVLCMVIYNCLIDKRQLFVGENEFWLMTSVIDHCIECQSDGDVHIAEWGSYVLLLLVKGSNFDRLYKQLVDYPHHRSFLLDVLLNELEQEKVDDCIPEDNLLYLCENMESKATCLMMLASQQNEQLQQESMLVYKSLAVLCEATSYTSKYNRLKKRKKLARCVIDLLKNIGAASYDTDCEPAVTFIRDLVRLIGNMSYKNEDIQDAVRESGGIPLVLNACNIDRHNKFLLQWAVFATRNLCEGNSTNQKLIANLERQGLKNDSILAYDTNIRVSIVDGKVKLQPINHIQK